MTSTSTTRNAVGAVDVEVGPARQLAGGRRRLEGPHRGGAHGDHPLGRRAGGHRLGGHRVALGVDHVLLGGRRRSPAGRCRARWPGPPGPAAAPAALAGLQQLGGEVQPGRRRGGRPVGQVRARPSRRSGSARVGEGVVDVRRQRHRAGPGHHRRVEEPDPPGAGTLGTRCDLLAHLDDRRRTRRPRTAGCRRAAAGPGGPAPPTRRPRRVRRRTARSAGPRPAPRWP